jgi:ribosomal peptide maturation radical SAM protein 1
MLRKMGCVSPLLQLGESPDAWSDHVVDKPFALVSMPTLSGRFPSFQLGLLKPTLARAGVPCQTFSMFLYFGAHVGWRLNEALAEVSPALVGEWIWTKAAFGERPEQAALDYAYFEKFGTSIDWLCREAGVDRARLIDLRDRAVFSFLDFCMEAVDWSRFSSVGLSCVFQQTMASLAFARRLKDKHPDLPIILGGGFFEDDIAEEVLKNCPQIDYIHMGDADETLPNIVRRLDAGDDLAGQTGVLRRTGGAIEGGRAPNLQDLDKTPIPDFDEYFYARKEGGFLDFSGEEQVMLPIETGRGCWWGMKNHCTFCGLNRAGMDFRAKSPDQVFDQLKVLHRKYGQLYFDAIDNIMAPEYTDALFGKLAEARADVKIHYEVRPSLKRAQLKKMRAGGLHSVQPGVESLSTHLLMLMNKRTTAMRNLEFIKWCTYYGVHNLYNILLRFAGETQADYDEQVELIERIPHLQPPKFITTVRADRGSPMFVTPDETGVVNLRPSTVYPYLYPEGFDLPRVAYYFEHDMPEAAADYRPIRAAVARWQQLWRAGPRPRLSYKKSWDTLTITDARDPAGAVVEHVLVDDEAALYEALMDGWPVEKLASRTGQDTAAVEARLGAWDSDALVAKRDGRWLALALPANRGH